MRQIDSRRNFGVVVARFLREFQSRFRGTETSFKVSLQHEYHRTVNVDHTKQPNVRISLQ
jgi:hypothetical protein